MQPADLPEVKKIADRIHTSLPEDKAIFRERLHLYSAGCLVLETPGGLAGYAISHPWQLGAPPALNSLLGQFPVKPDSFYIHDLALVPAARGAGAANAAVSLLIAMAEQSYLPSLSLVAVGGSERFWQRQGFQPAPSSKDLTSYGATARFMVRTTSHSVVPSSSPGANAAHATLRSRK